MVLLDVDPMTCVNPILPNAVQSKSKPSGLHRYQRPQSAVGSGEASHMAHSRTDSDLGPGAAYLPVRRRSLVLTPGLATRPAIKRSNTDASSKRGNRASAATKLRQPENSQRYDANALLPPSLPVAEGSQRCVSPMEAGYEQLGGIKFGTLRIMNTSPMPSLGERSDSISAHPGTATGAFPTETNECSVKERQGATLCNIESTSTKRLAEPKPRRHSAMEILSFAQEETADGAERVAPLQPSLEAKAAAHDTNSAQRTSPDRQRAARESWTAEYPNTEILQVRDDENAKSLRSSTKGGAATLQLKREDSGIVSASSSASSRRALSNIDSGYSSGTSPTQEITQNSLRIIMKATQTQKAAAVKLEDQQTATESPGVRRLRSFSSFVARRNSSETAPTPSTIQKPTCSQPDKPVRDPTLQRSVSMSGASERHGESMKTGRFYRLLLRSRSKDKSLGPYVAHDDFSTVPTVPNDIKERLKKHSKTFPTLSKKLTQANPSRRDSIQAASNMERIEEESQEQQQGTGTVIGDTRKSLAPQRAPSHVERKRLPPAPQCSQSAALPVATVECDATHHSITSHHNSRSASASHIRFKPPKEDLAMLPTERWRDELEVQSHKTTVGRVGEQSFTRSAQDETRVEAAAQLEHAVAQGQRRNWSLPKGAMVEDLWSCRSAARELSRIEPALVEQSVQE